MFACDFVFRIMFRYLGSLLIFISSYFSSVFGFFITRYHGDEGDKQIVDVKQAQNLSNDDKFCSSFSKESKLGDEKANISEFDDDDLGFESHDEETKAESSVYAETMTTSNTNSKYCFMNQNHIYGFMEVPKAITFTIHHEDFSDDDYPKLKTSAVFETEDSNDEIEIGAEDKLEKNGIHKVERKSFIGYDMFTGSNEDSKGTVTANRDSDLEDFCDENMLDVTGIQPELQTRRIHDIDEKNEDFGLMQDHSDKLQSDIPLFSFKFVLSSKVPNVEKLIKNHEHASAEDDVPVTNTIAPDQTIAGFTERNEDEMAQDRVQVGDAHETDSADDEVEQIMMESEPVRLIVDISDQDDQGLDQKGVENQCRVESHLLETAISDSDVESFIELEPDTGFFNERVFAHLNIGRLDEEEQESQDDDSDIFHERNLHGEEEEEESQTFYDNSEVAQEPKLHKEESNSKAGDHDSEKPHEPNSHEKESETKDDSSEQPHEPSLYDDDSDLSDTEDEMEHQDYINQLKLELKYVKSRGLPTILEDLESPKVLDDLKPLRTDTKMEHKERIQEIQKVYKIYADKMRKLDILSYQTMQSIDLLKLKITPAQSNSSKKPSLSPLKSLLSFKQSKTRSSGENTTEKSIKDLQKDYELVYTGQICISWEILHWQHKQVKELQIYDPHGFKQYNHVASEFQQFQVLLQRFIENEPFQETTRIQNYVAYRSVFRSFLQVPSIRDDSMKDKKARQEEKYMINIAMLTGIIGESIRLFSEFIRSGKEDYSSSTHTANGAFDVLEDHVDSELLIDVLENFQKKEKRVKEISRARSCIARKLRKNEDAEKLDHTLLNAQIELKLVEKVINMSKLTREQLVWCHSKLEDINFLSRKICLEPSNFLLFLPS